MDRRINARYLGLHLGTPQAIRRRIVAGVVWRAAATDTAMLDLAKFEDLHLLVDRRLRIVERMLYDVGSGGSRDWNLQEINTNPGGPWHDGWNRMFEYPRVPQGVFLRHCSPSAANGLCQAPGLAGWSKIGTDHLHHEIRLNPQASRFWDFDAPGDHYRLDYQANAVSPNSPALAIESLFVPSDDYQKRNLLYCDHVIHALHLEALLFSKKKRDPADLSWLTSTVAAHPKGWLRIYVPIWPGGEAYLGGSNEPLYFLYNEIHYSELQIGDHLIVYNHPAYDKSTVGGVWRLENALAVQLDPKALFQGHGTNPLSFDAMKLKMLKLFNKQLNHLRDIVQGHIKGGNTATELEFGNYKGKLLRRVPPSNSAYATSQQYADWWLRWDLDPETGEPAIALDAARQARAKKVHKVEYDSASNSGFFPLWEPERFRSGAPVLDGSGKIRRAIKVVATKKMIAGWTWYMPVDLEDEGKLHVICPRIG